MSSFPLITFDAANAVTPRAPRPANWVAGSLKLTAGAPEKNLVDCGSAWEVSRLRGLDRLLRTGRV